MAKNITPCKFIPINNWLLCNTFSAQKLITHAPRCGRQLSLLFITFPSKWCKMYKCTLEFHKTIIGNWPINRLSMVLGHANLLMRLLPINVTNPFRRNSLWLWCIKMCVVWNLLFYLSLSDSFYWCWVRHIPVVIICHLIAYIRCYFVPNWY